MTDAAGGTGFDRPNDASLDRIPLWAAYFALGALPLVVHRMLESGSLTQSWFYDVVGGSAVVAAFIGIARNRPERRLPWYLMATGQALFVAGDIMWNWYETIGESPFPSLADVLYLAGYPFIAFGLLLLIKRRIGDGDRGGLLDAAILTTAVAILSWTFFIRPLTIDTELDPLSLAITLAYPVADLLLIGVAMGLLTTPGARTPAFRMLGVSLVALLVADQIYAFQNLDESYVAGGALDSVYLIAYILFGTAVLHPSMRRLTDPAPVAVTWLGPVRMICLAAAMVTGPLLVTVGPDADGALVVIAAGTALLSLLVLARLYGLVRILARDVAKRRALESQLSYQAFHDPLTGLANRRRFVDHAEAALGGRSRVGGSPRCSWTSTTSRRSTTASGMPRGTSCWWPSPRGSATASVPRTWPRASAATSSASCCSTSRIRPTPRPWPSGCWPGSRPRSRSPGSRSRSMPASGWPSTPRRCTGWTTCSATPTSRCTRRRPSARAGSTSSTATPRAASSPSAPGPISGTVRRPAFAPARLEPGAG